MIIRITSLTSIVLKPESDAEKLILDSWYGKSVEVSPCIVNAGMNHPNRYIAYTFTFEEKKDERRIQTQV